MIARSPVGEIALNLMLKATFINAWMQLNFSGFVLDNFDRNRLIAEALVLSRSNGIK